MPRSIMSVIDEATGNMLNEEALDFLGDLVVSIQSRMEALREELAQEADDDEAR